MKKLFIIFLSCIFLFSCVFATQRQECEKTFFKVFEAPGYTKDQIYKGMKIWVAENFRSAKSVVELDEPEQGLLIGNGVVSYPCKGMGCLSVGEWRVPFTMRIDVKDNKFRLSFSNLQISAQGYAEQPIYYQAHVDKIKPVLLAFGDEIITALNQNKKTTSDW
ncbi:DUF4468 domain-containing protein [Desulfosudis oleivorans]|uniref:DUF4468 domain-containing protein n=1 Tax=Desulfosudis oleivorans (strain DSM 6200 / JCM 39069 / Hxd3) TaxID=96561 RepID=A8ZYX9_DESOH|nr:DUF4468 domain-containing protein [Desulfosudis oleivorans]ABW68752.1 hypothetical protein Dole_2949 [Desulfosudis oleivorans Hxd3]